jgi:hypothetical protein
MLGRDQEAMAKEWSEAGRGTNINCLTRRETVPFYRSKGMVYNALFMSVSKPYL